MPTLQQRFGVTIAFPADGDAIELAKSAGADTLILEDFALRRRNLRGPSQLLGWVRRIRSAKRSLDSEHRHNNFDMIYSNTFAAAIGPLLSRSWKVPHILHVRECPMDPRWQISTLCRVADRFSELVICNSDYTKSLLTGVRPALAHRIEVIHNGIELPASDTIIAPRVDGAMRISCVGRIHPKKGQGVLLRAVARASREGRSWECHFYGDALPEHTGIHDALKELVREEDLTETVFWHGFVDGAPRYAGHDVAVVPSVYPEEFSLVCAEAQAMSLPVVATGPGGPSEIVIDGSTGFIVAPSDSDALYERLAELDDDRELARRFGAAGSRRMRACFGRDAYGEKVAAALGAYVTSPAGVPISGRTRTAAV